MSRSRVSVIIIVLLTHVAIWAYPVAPGGWGNLAAFAAWVMAIFLAFGALVCLFKGPARSSWDGPWWFNWACRASQWAGLVWLVYHGAFALPALLLISTVVYWAGKRASEDLEREMGL